MIAFLMIGAAHAASLDQLEVAGAWGSPMATDPSATWWNPAGLAAERGTRYLIEVAPTLAKIHVERDDPYNGGPADMKLVGAIPFAGVVSDFGVNGLGIGISMAVPYARGAEAVDKNGPLSFLVREGMNQVIYFNAGAAYKPKGFPVSIGAGLSVVHSQWTAQLDSELTTSLDQSLTEQGQESGYTDEQIENPDYAVLLKFGKLKDTVVTFSTGIRADLPKVSIGASYLHSVKINHTGNVDMEFSCPPEEDILGRFGSEAYGLCYANIKADAQVGARLPARIHGGVLVKPIDILFIEAMGGATFWSKYTDYHVKVSNVQAYQEFQNEATPSKVEQDRLWARDNKNTYWLGLDVKAKLAKERLTVGARVIYDRSAVPDSALSPNNYDANTIIPGVLLAYDFTPWLGLGVSYSRYLLQTREVTDSSFRVTLDKENAPEDRYFYPQANGKYSGSIDRIGISLKGKIGGGKALKQQKIKKPKVEPPVEEEIEEPFEYEDLDEAFRSPRETGA